MGSHKSKEEHRPGNRGPYQQQQQVETSNTTYTWEKKRRPSRAAPRTSTTTWRRYRAGNHRRGTRVRGVVDGGPEVAPRRVQRRRNRARGCVASQGRWRMARPRQRLGLAAGGALREQRGDAGDSADRSGGRQRTQRQEVCRAARGRGDIVAEKPSAECVQPAHLSSVVALGTSWRRIGELRSREEEAGRYRSIGSRALR